MAKIALLSNVNMDPVVRLLQQRTEVYLPEGYGGELGALLNVSSSLYKFAPEYICLLPDLAELYERAGATTDAAFRQACAEWFQSFEKTLRPDIIYYVTDAYLRHTPGNALMAPLVRSVAETLWSKRLAICTAAHPNVRVFPYRSVMARLGEDNAFSDALWYMGRIPLTIKAQQALAAAVLRQLNTEMRTAKKVLVLDLDNTLWGGLAGEHDRAPLVLSDDHTGLAYKNLQRVILQMKEQGVLLTIVSKNNEADALEIIRKHPHMILREKDFAARRINWTPKHENIRMIARELNLGTDSFVFFDDSAQERALVKEMMPEVAVPDFPERPEMLASAMERIFHKYFEKGILTEEDKNKTEQYEAEHARSDLQSAAKDFNSYLKSLDIHMKRLDPARHVDRITQLFGKTNQFNLTTRRLTRAQIETLIADERTHVFCYNVTDQFGDLGLVAIAVLHMPGGVLFGDTWKSAASNRAALDNAVNASDSPVITDLIMSCRVMGRHIESAVIEEVEQAVRKEGYDTLRAVFLPTAKNKPVETLYQSLGYQQETKFTLQGAVRVAPGESGAGTGAGIYRIDLDDIPARDYIVTFENKLV